MSERHMAYSGRSSRSDCRVVVQAIAPGPNIGIMYLERWSTQVNPNGWLVIPMYPGIEVMNYAINPFGPQVPILPNDLTNPRRASPVITGYSFPWFTTFRISMINGFLWYTKHADRTPELYQTPFHW